MPELVTNSRAHRHLRAQNLSVPFKNKYIFLGVSLLISGVKLQHVLLQVLVPHPLKSNCATPLCCWRIKRYLCLSGFRPSGAVTSDLCIAPGLGGIWNYSVVLMYWGFEVDWSFWKTSGSIEICTLGCGVLWVDVKQFSLNKWPFPRGSTTQGEFSLSWGCTRDQRTDLKQGGGGGSSGMHMHSCILKR